MIKRHLKKIDREVCQFLDTVKHSPDARLKSREDFYKKYGDATLGEYGYGNSELAFMKWENRRVLHSDPNAPKSEWWDAINLRFIYLSELGAKARETNFPKNKLPVPARFWVEFIENPDATSWYRAHNSSIIDAYLKYPDLAKKENLPEQIFINVVLYRLLFAQAMVEGKDFAFGRLGKIFAHPKSSAVDLITQFESFYPENYPMTEEEQNHLLGKCHNLHALGMKFLDDVLIEPEFAALYKNASEWNQQPLLTQLLVANKPAYPDGIPKSEGKKNILIKWMMSARKWWSS